MYETGVVRHIDNLGRIVIPKELRRVLKLDAGDEVAMYVDAQSKIPTLTLRKYSALYNFEELTKMYTEILFKVTGEMIVICDTARVIASSLSSSIYVGKSITTSLANYISHNKLPVRRNSRLLLDTMACVKDDFDSKISAIYPIYQDSHPLGAIVLLGQHAISDSTHSAAVAIASALSAQVGC